MKTGRPLTPPESARSMPRLLALNNYDLARVEAEVARGDKPAHHLFGVDALRRAGWDITLVPPDSGPATLRTLDAALRRMRWPVPLGSLAQQWLAWRTRRQWSAIYAPCQTQTQALAYARALGLADAPLVTLAHHPLERGRLAWMRSPFLRWQFAGTTKFPALSAPLAAAIARAAGRGAEFSRALSWGPEVAYYDRFRRTGSGHGAAAAGRTGRDWPTMLQGAGLAGGALTIYTTESTACSASPNVRLHRVASEAELPYPRLLTELAGARVLAIPLRRDSSLAGLTNLNDALGLGKPVVMTRHPLIDLDLEGEGIGRWVEPGDVAGWAGALRWFDSHPAEAEAMGRRARAIAEARWNYSLFCAELTRLLCSVVDDSNRSPSQHP